MRMLPFPKVLGCCRNFWGDFGWNAFIEGLLQSVNSEQMQYARDMLVGKRVARADISCTTCNIYLDMKADGEWLEREAPGALLRAARRVFHAVGLAHCRQWLKTRLSHLRRSESWRNGSGLEL